MKKSFLMSIIVVTFIVTSTTLTTTAAPSYNDYKQDGMASKKTFTIETKIYHNGYIKKILTEVTIKEAEEIKECIKKLNEAINYGNKRDIMKYQSVLAEKGILGEKPGRIPYINLGKNIFLSSEENISNMLCYVNAVGEGMLIFTIGAILGLLASNGIILPIPIYIIILFLTHVVPFRIALPIGILTIEKGSISTIGIEGLRKIETINTSITGFVCGFNGLTINIPSVDGNWFLFISGFALVAAGWYP
ncbi:MAG: hypothetical protein DRN05_01495 [Thermoplasmata archaeon]|nr:MAG: hypothetical protein DRN05_01495 [Thermoplasmata archaeon]